MKPLGILFLALVIIGCGGSSATIANDCKSLQQTCLDRGMCLVSTNSGTTGGSAGGSYGGGGVSANGSFSDSASCGFTCSECGDGGTKQALSTNGNCNGATINAPGATINCGGAGSSSNSNTSSSGSSGAGSSSGSSGTGTSSSSGGAPTNYGPWSDCFDPSESYPTGVLKYSNCTAYCQSFGKNLSRNCLGPNPATDVLGTESGIVWCGLSSGTCGDISQYPDYVSQCYTTGVRTSVCTISISVSDVTTWASVIMCPGKTQGAPPTSAQCCCG